MLKDEDYEEITQEIQEKGQLTELLLLKLIASFLNIEDDEDIEKWRDKNLLLVNQMAKKAKKIISQNGVTDNDISKTLNLAITTALYNQDLIYKMALDKGLIKNKAGDATKKAYYKQILAGAIKNTRKYKNSVNTTALNMSKKAFRDIINQTYLDVSAGNMSHIDAVERATKALTNKGITGINYISKNGTKTRRTVSSAIRTMIVTSTSQTAGLMQLERANDWGQDLVEVSSHSGARPEHAKWQGKIYSISGKHKKYPHLTSSTNYGTIEGLKGVNCTHDFYPFFEGLSQQTFKPTSDMQKNSEIYEQSQKQRAFERKLRKENTEKEVQKAAGLEVDEEPSETEKQYRQFLKETGRTRRVYRERAEAISPKPPKPTAPTPPVKPQGIETQEIKPKPSIPKETEPKPKPKIDNAKEKEKISRVRKMADADEIEHVPVKRLSKPLSTDEIINKLGGADKTKGSCCSLGFAFVGNENGLDVTDFRGGKSQSLFASRLAVKDIANLANVDAQIVKSFNEIETAAQLLRGIEKNKNYFLSVGKHVAIVRHDEKLGLQYLELQSAKENGFKKLDFAALKNRFGAKKQHTQYKQKIEVDVVLIKNESLKNNKEFENILGYLNTASEKQLKGVGGGIK